MGVYIGNKFVEYVKTRTVVSNPLLTFTWSDHLINDSCWLRADTFSWQSGDVYKSVYNELATQAVDWLETHDYTTDYETENGVNFWRTSKGYKIAIYDGNTEEEQKIINCFNNTGVAWFYLLDRVNKRFKLPRTKFGFEGLRTSVGSYIEAGLPDHNHYLNLNTRTVQTGTNFVNAKQPVTGGDVSGYASETNPIYGSSDTVQERATQMYLYFFVGNTAYNETSVDVGALSESINNKLDTSLTNMDSVGEQKIKSIVDTAISGLQLDWSNAVTSTNNFTAPTNGFCMIGMQDHDSNYTILIYNEIDEQVMSLYGGYNNDAGSFFSCILNKGFRIYVLSDDLDHCSVQFVPFKSEVL